jgi:hypothetical protein
LRSIFCADFHTFSKAQDSEKSLNYTRDMEVKLLQKTNRRNEKKEIKLHISFIHSFIYGFSVLCAFLFRVSVSVCLCLNVRNFRAFLPFPKICGCMCVEKMFSRVMSLFFFLHRAGRGGKKMGGLKIL